MTCDQFGTTAPFLRLTESNLEHLLVFKAICVQSWTPPRFEGFPSPIHNASDPERVDQERVRNVSNSERIWFVTCPIWMRLIRNASGLGDRSLLKGGGPMIGLGTDHFISGPIRGDTQTYRRTLQPLDWLGPEGQVCENLIYRNVYLLNLTLKNICSLGSPVSQTTWKLKYTWVEKCQKMKAKSSHG